MKILYYDCFAGISGDMNLGAMVDLGVAPDYLCGELQKLHLDGYELRFSGDQRKGITGTKADVLLKDLHKHEHEHEHEHVHHHHHGDHHEHRNLHDIAHIINDSSLPESVKKMSMDIFRLVAQAEAKIHGKPVEEVHFHEVGAVDSIVDIVGAAICVDCLKPDRIIASPVEMGGGFVQCAHGTFPVPAPATLEIMKGKPMKFGAVPFETATPTGVAILAALADEFSVVPSFTVVKTGYGVGHRDTDIPNVLRVCLCESGNSAATSSGAVMLECNIDDMNPEHYAYVMERLFAAGADDVFLHNIIMKKTRPAVMLSVLCAPEKIVEMEQILFTETSTLGMRSYAVEKKMLERRTEITDTPWGQVRVKIASREGRDLKSKPEYEDCAEIARKNALPIEQIYRLVRHKTPIS
ncbi:MAG: nickel pincer cofactor biosynthesis protein LarC [Bacteroidales bacterium]|jgi:uncharacterized protein (TIGR00299 family) protein|nr:nickel pincer cofactor biosynthesis protein LarC [Bacteroidales bacterium]